MMLAELIVGMAFTEAFDRTTFLGELVALLLNQAPLVCGAMLEHAKTMGLQSKTNFGAQTETTCVTSLGLILLLRSMEVGSRHEYGMRLPEPDQSRVVGGARSVRNAMTHSQICLERQSLRCHFASRSVICCERGHPKRCFSMVG